MGDSKEAAAEAPAGAPARGGLSLLPQGEPEEPCAQVSPPRGGTAGLRDCGAGPRVSGAAGPSCRGGGGRHGSRRPLAPSRRLARNPQGGARGRAPAARRPGVCVPVVRVRSGLGSPRESRAARGAPSLRPARAGGRFQNAAPAPGRPGNGVSGAAPAGAQALVRGGCPELPRGRDGRGAEGARTPGQARSEGSGARGRLRSVSRSTPISQRELLCTAAPLKPKRRGLPDAAPPGSGALKRRGPPCSSTRGFVYEILQNPKTTLTG